MGPTPTVVAWDGRLCSSTESLLLTPLALSCSSGHDHLYERFAPLDAAGEQDPEEMRQFTVGTGGGPHYTAERVAPGSELIIDDAHGILRLELAADGYARSFLTVEGGEADSGSGLSLLTAVDRRRTTCRGPGAS